MTEPPSRNPRLGHDNLPHLYGQYFDVKAKLIQRVQSEVWCLDHSIGSDLGAVTDFDIGVGFGLGIVVGSC